MIRKNCVYCNKEITTPSREHVIQNALGGLYESEDICCPECNNYISKEIDKPFTTIFNPIIGSIDNLTKTHNKNSTPTYNGTVSYDGQQYEAKIKAGKVISCPELSRMLRRDISGVPLEIVSYQFNLDNVHFQNGIAKIAFNYALAMNVDFKYLESGLNIERQDNKIAKIEYNYPLVPFCPMNALDTVLEMYAPTQLYHNLVLFSQESKLWCYVDLFNTFQYYVLLSDQLPNGTNIYHNYTQTLRKIPRPEELEIFSPKDAMIYAQQYGVQPTMNPDVLIERIRNADLNKPPLGRLIEKQMAHINPFNPAMANIPPDVFAQLMYAIQCYFTEDEYGDEIFIKENFRTITPLSQGHAIASYPDAAAQTIAGRPEILKHYTTAKFNKLNAHLLQKTK